VSVDPLQFEYPYYAPYQYAGNKPITFIDLDGLKEYNYNGRFNTSIYLGIGGLINYTLGAGFSFSLFGGISTKVQQGNGFGYMSGLNISTNFSYKGLGTSPYNKFSVNMVATPSLTFGYGKGEKTNLNLFTERNGSAISNSFGLAVTYGHNYILSSGRNSDGSGRNQINGAIGVKIGGLQVATYNDTRKMPFFSP
jgi:hypothetical protein